MVRTVEPVSKPVVSSNTIFSQLSQGSTWVYSSFIQATSRVAETIFEFTNSMNAIHSVERSHIPLPLGFESLSLKSCAQLLNQIENTRRQREEILKTLSQIQVACCIDEPNDMVLRDLTQTLRDFSRFYQKYRYDKAVVHALEVTGAVVLETIASSRVKTQDSLAFLLMSLLDEKSEKVLKRSFGESYETWFIEIKNNIKDSLSKPNPQKILKQLVEVSSTHPLKEWSMSCLDSFVSNWKTGNAGKMSYLRQRAFCEENPRNPLFIDNLTMGNLSRALSSPEVRNSLNTFPSITNWNSFLLFIQHFVDFYEKTIQPFEKVCKLLAADELLPLILHLCLQTESSIFLQKELLIVLPILGEMEAGTEKEYILTNLEIICSLLQNET